MRGLRLYSSVVFSVITYSGVQKYSRSHVLLKGAMRLKFDKSMQMKQAPLVEMKILKKSLAVVRSEVCV